LFTVADEDLLGAIQKIMNSRSVDPRLNVLSINCNI
jgi:hypothetical protein